MIAAATRPARRPNHAARRRRWRRPAPTPKATAITRARRNTAPGSSANHCSTPPRWITRQPRRQQVRQRGRVDEVAGVEVPAGHRHRVRDEVRALVEVVRVRQAVAEAPEPQRRGDDQDQREDERGRAGAPHRLGRRRGRVFMRRGQSASEASHAALSRRAARARSRRRAAPCRPARPRRASRARRARAAPSRCRSRAG